MEAKDHERIKWRCRRGMLEIDLFLVPFFENCFAGLSSEDKASFIELLEEQDPDLHTYLMDQRIHEQSHIRAIISKIREHRFTVSRNQFL